MPNIVDYKIQYGILCLDILLQLFPFQTIHKYYCVGENGNGTITRDSIRRIKGTEKNEKQHRYYFHNDYPMF